MFGGKEPAELLPRGEPLQFLSSWIGKSQRGRKQYFTAIDLISVEVPAAQPPKYMESIHK